MVIASKATAEIGGTVDDVQLHVTISGVLLQHQDPAVMRDFVHQIAEAAEQALLRLGGEVDGGNGVSANHTGTNS